MMTTDMRAEPPNSAVASQLIDELEAHLARRYLQESRQGTSVEKLICEAVAFFCDLAGRDGRQLWRCYLWKKQQQT
jgi:hypothetical protein